MSAPAQPLFFAGEILSAKLIMTFEIGSAFNGGAEWLCGSSAVYGIVKNPVFTALLITALALVVIYSTYKSELKGTGWRRGVKTAFWLAILVSGAVFVHYYALEHALQTSHVSQGVRTVVDSIHHSATTGGGYAVYPTGQDDADEMETARSPPPARSPPLAASPLSPAKMATPPKIRGRPDNVGANVNDAGVNDVTDLGLEEVVLVSPVR